MQKATYSIFINASKEKTWNTMLNDATYREWTKAFDGSSHFVGDWSKGSKMLFLGSGGQEGAGEMGMVSMVRENRPFDFVSLEHIGFYENGVEDTTSEKIKEWTPSFENYTFTEKDNGTEIRVDIDVPDTYKAMFDDMWPKALLSLKEIAERK